MKKLRFIAALCAIGLFFASCGKEDNEGNGAKNYITYGNETSSINVGPCGFVNELHMLDNMPGYHFDADFTFGEVNSHIFLNISSACKDKKVDLSRSDVSTPYTFEINSSAEAGYPYDIHQYCNSYYPDEVGHSSVGTWFKTGTMELKDDGTTLSLDVDATLQDGRTFKMNITTQSTIFE